MNCVLYAHWLRTCAERARSTQHAHAGDCYMCSLLSVFARLVLHIPSSSWAGKRHIIIVIVIIILYYIVLYYIILYYIIL